MLVMVMSVFSFPSLRCPFIQVMPKGEDEIKWRTPQYQRILEEMPSKVTCFSSLSSSLVGCFGWLLQVLLLLLLLLLSLSSFFRVGTIVD